ncbi:MAG: c-type cytochrome [Geobacteraceae bacterium]|nr:c-type cytochrome [Geobacteraceae bacterium]
MKNQLIRSSLFIALAVLAGCGSNSTDNSAQVASAQVAAGKDVFLNETFGNEKFFGDTLGLHTVLNGVAPKDAVALGVQVDLNKVPADIVAVMTGSDLAAKDAALNDPTVTRRLIKAGAVIGVKGFYATTSASDTTLTSVGISCGLCHVTVKPTTFNLTAGATTLPIGDPLYNGVPNAEMDAGKILSFTPFAVANNLSTTLAGWGPGRFDIRALNELDDGVDNPTAFPPLWNFPALQANGYALGWDGMFKGTNALASIAEAVYDLVMHGNGSFATSHGAIPPALAFPPRQAVLNKFQDNPASVITADKLLQVQTFLQSLQSPAAIGFDQTQAAAGKNLFEGKAKCATCHPAGTEFISAGRYSDITVTPPTGDLAGGIKVPGLRGISLTAPYFHDNSAATLLDVVNRFDTRDALGLTDAEKTQLVEYLKSL